MIQACRDKLTGLVNSRRLSHSGLILQRLLRQQDDPESERTLLDTARRAQRNASDLYRQALERRRGWLKQWSKQGGRVTFRGGSPHGPIVVGFDLTTPAGTRLIVGLGNESPLETGVTLHHTYGVPIIPGSALKGLAAHYCSQVFGELPGHEELRLRIEFTDETGRFRVRTGKQFSPLFGRTDDAGFITFHDAWITSESLTRDDEGLLFDVMTPHHGDYYGGKRFKMEAHPTSQGPRNGDLIPPTDFDNPVPVSFLSVRGTFHFVLTCADASPNGEQWLNWSADLLRAALANWGVGGKTSSGYGRLVESSTTTRMHLADPGITASKPAPAKLKLPAPNELVDAELIERREKSGGKVSWRAKHLASGISGPIQNSEAVSSESKVGEELQLYVAYANPQEIAFKFPTPTIRDQISKSQNKAKQERAQKPGKRREQRRR